MNEIQNLIPKLKEWDDDARMGAANRLAEIGTSAVEPLIVALRTGDDQTRRIVPYIFAKIRDARTVEALIAVLRNPDPIVRYGAAEALGEIGDSRATQPLIPILRDNEPMVRHHAAEALGKIGDPRAVPELERLALNDKEWTIHGSIAEAARAAIEAIRH